MTEPPTKSWRSLLPGEDADQRCREAISHSPTQPIALEMSGYTPTGAWPFGEQWLVLTLNSPSVLDVIPHNLHCDFEGQHVLLSKSGVA